MEFWVTQAFNGVSYGALLFLLAGGLSLIFGMMRIVNMTHGSYYLLGGYVGLTVIWRGGPYLLAILVAALAIAVIGLGEWNAFLRRLSGQELGQVLTTMGFALIFQDLGLIIWGGDPYTIPIPKMLSGAFRFGTALPPGVSRLHGSGGDGRRRGAVAGARADAGRGEDAGDGGRRRDGARGGDRRAADLAGRLRAGGEPGGGGRGRRRRVRRRVPGRRLRDPARTPSWW